MNYVTTLDFEDAADFEFLKSLIETVAVEKNLNIFDNIFDWSILLTNQEKIPSSKNITKKEFIAHLAKLD